MTRLDQAKPRADGNYPVEISIGGEWITLALLNRQGVEKLCDYAGTLQDEGYTNDVIPEASTEAAA